MTEQDSALQEAQQKIKELQARLDQEHNLRLGQRATMEMQANKIQKLLQDNEELGADKAQICERLRSAAAILGTDEESIETAAAELRQWKELGQNKLAPTFDAAQQQADVLWSYVKAMESPGHRATMSVGGLLQKCWLGRKMKEVFAAILAFRKA